MLLEDFLPEYVGEAVYPGNIGAMEIMSFYKKATPKQKKTFQRLLDRGKKALAWKLIQRVTGTQLKWNNE